MVVYWLVPRDFLYLGGFKHIIFLKHVATEDRGQ